MRALTFLRILMRVVKGDNFMTQAYREADWRWKFRLWFGSRPIAMDSFGHAEQQNTSAACLREKLELQHYIKSQPKDYAP